MQPQVVSVFSNSMKFMSADTGELLFSQKLNGPADQFMLINLKESKSQLVLAMNTPDLEGAAGGKVHAYPSKDIPTSLDLDNQEIFFTSIDRSSGKLTGYKLGQDWTANKVWQLRVAQSDAERVL